MIPAVSITDFVLAVLCFGIAARIFVSHKGELPVLTRYFFLFYLFFGISFLFFAIPEIFSKNATTITVFNIFSYLAFFIALAYISQVPFDLLGKTNIALAMFYIALLFGIFFVIMRFVNYQPSYIVAQENGIYMFWKPDYAGWLRSATGIFSAFIAVVTMIVFYTQGYKSRGNHSVFVRSMWIGTGLLFLVFSSLSTYAFNPKASFTPIFVSTIFAIIGLVIIFVGVLRKTESQDIPPK